MWAMLRSEFIYFVVTSVNARICLLHAPLHHPACSAGWTPLSKDGLGSLGSCRQLSDSSRREAFLNMCLSGMGSWGNDCPLFLQSLHFSSRVAFCCLNLQKLLVPIKCHHLFRVIASLFSESTPVPSLLLCHLPSPCVNRPPSLSTHRSAAIFLTHALGMWRTQHAWKWFSSACPSLRCSFWPSPYYPDKARGNEVCVDAYWCKISSKLHRAVLGCKSVIRRM